MIAPRKYKVKTTTQTERHNDELINGETYHFHTTRTIWPNGTGLDLVNIFKDDARFTAWAGGPEDLGDNLDDFEFTLWCAKSTVEFLTNPLN